MKNDIYQRLRKGVAKHSAYFQATPSGVEIDFLKKIFTEEEAELYLNLTGNLETPQQIARRANQDTATVAVKLKQMIKKGLVFPKTIGETYYYAAPPFAHGILEHQVHRLDLEMAKMYEDYIWAEKLPEDPEPGDSTSGGGSPEEGSPEEGSNDQEEGFAMPLRSLPVKVPINITRPVAPYEDVIALIKNQDRIALTKCFCAVQQKTLGTGCKQPVEVCFLLGFYAEYYIKHGMGRKVSQEEALDVMGLAEEAGLVHQIPDSKDPGAICNCCPDCCGELRVLKMFPNPAAFVTSSYFSKIDPDLCDGCETCVDRCPMGGISMKTDIACINLDRCIGCGLCINTCPSKALTLEAKPEKEMREPPDTNPFMRSSKDIESTLL